MNTLQLLISTKLKVIRALVFEKSVQARLRNLSLILFMILMLYAAYVFFYNLIFKYVVNLEDIGFLLIERLVSTGFLLFFFMLIISSFATALATLFRSAETEYLFSTPVTDLEVFTGKYINIAVLSSWAILIMALPILYSYAKVRDFGTAEYALTGIIVLFPFVILATSLGSLFALLASNLSKRISVRRQIFYGAVLFIVLIYSIIRFSKPTEMVIPFTEDFRALNLFINNFRMNSHPLTPNFWLIQCLRALVHDNYSDFFLYGSALITSALFSLSVLYTVARKIFFNTWLASTEETFIKKGRKSGRVSSGILLFTQPTSNQIRALINKDILTFIRDPGQWAQLFILLALLALYFVNLRFVPKNIEIEQWRTIISLMNFGFCGLVLATLAVRFVFPSYSLEGDAIWVLSSAPVKPSTLFREKFWTAFISFLVLTEAIAFVSGSILELEGLFQILTIGGILLMSITLTSLAVGFGAAFPDFSERNPSRIASSPGGMLMIVCSLFYIGIMMILVAVPGYKYTEYLITGGEFPRDTIIVSAIGVFVVNAVTNAIPLWMGARAIKTREL